MINTVLIVQHIIGAQLLCMSLLEHTAAAPYVSCCAALCDHASCAIEGSAFLVVAMLP